jgi:type IV secretion system protein VirB5
MKKLTLSLILAGGLSLSSAAFAQIPVTDGASIGQQIAAQVETIAKWKLQYDQMVSQIDQAKQQYESLTGSRGLGNIMNNPALRDYLPGDWQAVYDAVKDGGYAGLSGTAKTVYDKNKVYDACQFFPEEQQRLSCEAMAVKGAQDKGFALDAYEKAKSRINQIDQLMSKINDTADPKAIAELQGRIAAEQANIQNEQTKLQMYSMVAAAEDRVQKQRQREINAKVVDKRSYPTLQIINPLDK